jgi:putative oxidoreductase
MWKKMHGMRCVDSGLLVLRLAAGLMLAFGHGLGKLKAFDHMFHGFANPIGFGPEVSYVLTVGAEFFCALLIAVGLFTRLATIPLLILFAVIFFVVQADKSMIDKEIVIFYFAAFLTIFLTGPGKYSIDAFWCRRKLAK